MLKQLFIFIIICFPIICFFSGCGTLYDADNQMRQENYQEAIRLYSQYLDEQPDSLEGAKKLGLAYYRAGVINKATPQFQSVLKNDRSDPRATLYLALCYFKTGQSLKAADLLMEYENKDMPIVKAEMEKQIEISENNGVIGADGPPADDEALRLIENAVISAIYRQEASDSSQGGGSGGGGSGGGG